MPFDTAKVRLQMQGVGVRTAGPKKYRNVLQTMRTVAFEEGATRLYAGLPAALARQACFTTLRLGLYDPVRDRVSAALDAPGASPSVATRVVAGVVTGCGAMFVSNPTEVLRVTMQAGNSAGSTEPRFRSTAAALRHIGSTTGVRGMWRGAVPSTMRSGLMSAVELVSADLTMHYLRSNHGVESTAALSIAGGLTAGLAGTMTASPLDVIKTRMMANRPATAASAAPADAATVAAQATKAVAEHRAAGRPVVYRNMGDAAMSILRSEGPLAFYKGAATLYVRVGLFNLIMFSIFVPLREIIAPQQAATPQQ